MTMGDLMILVLGFIIGFFGRHVYNRRKDENTRREGIYEAFKCNHPDYNPNETEAEECLLTLKNLVLGEDWYIDSPMSTTQANNRITKEIMDTLIHKRW